MRSKDDDGECGAKSQKEKQWHSSNFMLLIALIHTAHPGTPHRHHPIGAKVLQIERASAAVDVRQSALFRFFLEEPLTVCAAFATEA